MFSHNYTGDTDFWEDYQRGEVSLYHIKRCVMLWLMWLSGLSAGL